MGVHFNNRKQKWIASIMKLGREFKKSFFSFEDAVAARKIWEANLEAN